MRVRHVSLKPTKGAIASGSPSLTPELLAACGARYSRNDEGLDSILSKVDPTDEDKSVDSIFRMLDYGHQSIADMVPIAIFIDNISLWLALQVWHLCPTAGGQESSTRYIKIDSAKQVNPEEVGIPAHFHKQWNEASRSAFTAYSRALAFWSAVEHDYPFLLRIPVSLIESTKPVDKKKLMRLRRNFAFDHSRYFLPLSACTNVMLIMSARAWVTLVQHLASHPVKEANLLAQQLTPELSLSAPRMTKYACSRDSLQSGLAQEFHSLTNTAQKHDFNIGYIASPSNPYLDVSVPPEVKEFDLVSALRFHQHRYAWIGSALKRSIVRFGWNAIPIAEIRDLNRHRTGYKHFTLFPNGFYSAADQLVPLSTQPFALEKANQELKSITETILVNMQLSIDRLKAGDPTFVYWLLMGGQTPFEHVTTADKFIYEAELRTGLGAHFCYAKRMSELLQLWYKHFPQTQPFINEGTAEPE